MDDKREYKVKRIDITEGVYAILLNQNDAEDNFNHKTNPVGLHRGFIQKDGNQPHYADGEVHDAKHLIGLACAEQKDGDAQPDEECAKYRADFSNAACTRGG